MSNTPEVPAPIDSFIEAVNRHNETAFLDAFTSDGSVDDWGRVFTGREAIKGWSDNEFIGADGVLTPEEASDSEDGTLVVGDWASTHANGRSAFTFATEGGKITRMTIREG